METIKAATALQTQKKISEILNYTPATQNYLCPVKDVLHVLADKWSVFAMMLLGYHRTLRFNEMKKGIQGISQKMLTVTLKTLESHGLITRKMYPQIPPKVEYSITPLGEEFLQHLVVVLNWACVNNESLARNKKKKERQDAKACLVK